MRTKYIILKNKYTRQRLEAACKRAANISRPTLSLIKNILAKNLDQQPLLFDDQETKIPDNENIRGSGNYK